MKEIGPMSYPGKSHGQGILVNFKISDSTLVAEKVNHENSDEVIVCAKKNIKLFHSMLLVTLFVRCLFIAIRISHGKV